MNDYKVIFHIDEMNKWKLLLKNVSNLADIVDMNHFEIEVLANSEAVNFYKHNKEANEEIDTMKKLNSDGVKFVACNNALKAYNLQKDYLFDFIEIVPAGVLELVYKQSEGYAYIKP